jgi:hypothetical protein
VHELLAVYDVPVADNNTHPLLRNALNSS